MIEMLDAPKPHQVWKTNDGRSVEVIEYTDDGFIMVKLEDGTFFKYPRESLVSLDYFELKGEG